MNEAVKTKLYTFDKMKDVVIDTISKMSLETFQDKDLDDPSKCMLLESLVGAKILAYLDERHEKGEI